MMITISTTATGKILVTIIIITMATTIIIKIIMVIIHCFLLFCYSESTPSSPSPFTSMTQYPTSLTSSNDPIPEIIKRGNNHT